MRWSQSKTRDLRTCRYVVAHPSASPCNNHVPNIRPFRKKASIDRLNPKITNQHHWIILRKRLLTSSANSRRNPVTFAPSIGVSVVSLGDSVMGPWVFVKIFTRLTRKCQQRNAQGLFSHLTYLTPNVRNLMHPVIVMHRFADRSGASPTIPSLNLLHFHDPSAHLLGPISWLWRV
jgi:hypothetical protein